MPARAGTLTINIGSTGCGLFADSTNVSGLYFNQPPDCTPIIVSNLNGNLYSAGQFGQLIAMAPPGISIIGAATSGISTDPGCCGSAWWMGSVWTGGGSTTWPSGYSLSRTDSIPGGSPYWGFAMSCPSICGDGSVSIGSVTLTAVEYQSPTLVADAPNVWYMGSAYGSPSYVWNPPGDPWPLTLSATDPSGVCQFDAVVEGTLLSSPVASVTTNAWQQCPDPNVWTVRQGAEVDTRSYISNAGSMPLTIQAYNAAGVEATDSETVKVDNDPVSVSLTSPNDPNPTLWVNHPVTVQATATAGPSGLGGTNCSVDGSKPTAYPAGGVTVAGTGVHSVSCTAWNNAVDPQWNHATGTSTMTLHIDQTPPSLSFVPQDPASPTTLVVDTGDSASGVSGGSIRMAPAGTQNWTDLPTSFDGQHLVAQIDDAGLSGSYQFEATSCDAVGNCASTTETMPLPLRLVDTSSVSFHTIDIPAKVVHTRVLVGWHWRTVRRHGGRRRVRTGGHLRTIRLVIARNQTCAVRRVRTGRRRWREIRACRIPHLALVDYEHVGYGRPVTIHGLLLTAQGVAVPAAPVEILAAPDNGQNQFAPVAAVTTDATGGWSATLPPGPSRIIRASFAGSHTLLPASGQATVSVPARIGLSVTPRTVPWSGAVVFHGHLEGGYIPPDGVALRLLVRYPIGPEASDLLAFRTNSLGAFKITWSYGSGHGVARYPFWVATTATESDYPFAPAKSRRVRVTFGESTPRASGSSRAHRRQRRHRHHLRLKQ